LRADGPGNGDLFTTEQQRTISAVTRQIYNKYRIKDRSVIFERESEADVSGDFELGGAHDFSSLQSDAGEGVPESTFIDAKETKRSRRPGKHATEGQFTAVLPQGHDDRREVRK